MRQPITDDGMSIHFSKMQGAGNDFVVLDLRQGGAQPTAALVAAIGDRHTGVGFDQLLTIEASEHSDAVARYRVWNSDGSSAQQCGNGARCIAAWLLRAGTAKPPCFVLESPSGLVEVECLDDGRFELTMGVPEFRPEHIPMLVEHEQAKYTTTLAGKLIRFGAVSMGNPHALILVDDISLADVADLGPKLQASALFPESVNVGFAQIVSRSQLRLRVYERGVGETLACGSGACAAAAILMRQGRIDRRVEVELPGGTLEITWPDDTATLRMAGPAAFVFEGEWIA